MESQGQTPIIQGMKLFVQLSIIMCLCLIGEVLASVIPFPIPATILALLLLVLLLKTKVLKLSWVDEAGDLLLKYMTFLFVPVGVKLISYFNLIKDVWFLLILVCIVVTIFVFFVTTFTVKLVLKLTGKGGNA